jgi:hypothetical protein
VRVTQHAPADTENQRTVPAHQGSEGIFIAAGGIALQELLIRRVAAGACHQAAQPTQELTVCHEPCPSESTRDIYNASLPGERIENFARFLVYRPATLSYAVPMRTRIPDLQAGMAPGWTESLRVSYDANICSIWYDCLVEQTAWYKLTHA